jgi:hypothetical protein
MEGSSHGIRPRRTFGSNTSRSCRSSATWASSRNGVKAPERVSLSRGDCGQPLTYAKKTARTASERVSFTFPPASMRPLGRGAQRQGRLRTSLRALSSPAADIAVAGKISGTRRCRTTHCLRDPERVHLSDRCRTTSTTASCINRCGRPYEGSRNANRPRAHCPHRRQQPDGVRADWIDF